MQVDAQRDETGRVTRVTWTWQRDKLRSALARDGAYLLLVHFDPVRMVLAAFWLIPTASIATVATEQPDKFVLRPSLNPDARDRCRRYRYDDAHALAAAILRVIEAD